MPLAVPPEDVAKEPMALATAAGGLSSCHYPRHPRSRKLLILSALLSAALHAVLIVDFRHAKKKAAPKPEPELPGMILLMPEIKDLEEPEESKPAEDAGTPEDPGMPAPMLADLPRLPQVNDFVQQLDFDSLIERTNPNQDKMWTIPENIRHGGRIGDNMGNIFNLADLERAPEPVLQPSPIYPNGMRHDGIDGRVTVEFIVDTKGNVVNAMAYESNHYGFNDAAVTGVLKWKFRPGMKGGRKVNTRMRVPILFHFIDTAN